jgi:patatin-like phospholipase/acyl hydrolase
MGGGNQRKVLPLCARLPLRIDGQMAVGAARTRLVIPSWNPTGQGVYVWKTRHCGRFKMDHNKPVLDALVSTASAPTYFSSSRASGGTGLVDGGVWANNPMLVAAVEALGVLRWRAEDIRMLALGCVKEDFIPPPGGGLLRWALPAPQVFLQVRHRMDQLLPVFFDAPVRPFVPLPDDATDSSVS